jgi:hypothetical protein
MTRSGLFDIIDRVLEPKAESRTPLYSLFEALRFEMSQGIVFDGITNLKRVTTHLAVFDIGVTLNREVQDHRDLFAAKGTDEEVFHDASTVPQISIA